MDESEEDVNDKLLDLANLFMTSVGAGVEDGALTVYSEAMNIIQERGSLPKWELLFHIGLLSALGESLFPDDSRRLKRRIVELAIENVTIFRSDPAFEGLGLNLDRFLAELPDADRAELAPLLDKLGPLYTRPDPREMLLTPPVEGYLPPEVLEIYRVISLGYLGELAELPTPPPDLAALHDELCALIDGVDLPFGSRHLLQGEIHHRTMTGGIQLGQQDAILVGARAMLENPRNHNALNDRLEAAYIILWTLWEPGVDAAVIPTTVLASIKELIWNSLELVFRNNVIRFVALRLHQLYPLVAAYVDYAFSNRDSQADAIRLITSFQGALTAVALWLLSDDTREEGWLEFVIDELDSLLQHQGVGGAEDVDEEDAQPDTRWLTVRGGRPAFLSLAETSERHSGYEETEFVLVTTNKEDLAHLMPPEVTALRRELPPETALLYLFASERSIYGGGMTSEAEPTMIRLCGLEHFTERSVELTGQLQGTRTRFLLEPDDFGWIHSLLIAPVLAEIPGKVRALSLLGPQIRLPLHLAYDRDHASYLLDQYTITYTHMAHGRRKRASESSESPPHAIVFDGSRSGMDVLRHVDGELTSIMLTLAGRYQVTRYSSRRDVVSPTAEANVLHYAGHMNSRTGEHRWSLRLEDGPVMPHELMRCVGPQTQLVSLFSCYSADQVGTGPTPIGISTLLGGSGVQNVIGCLWPIPDETASHIASDLYTACLRDSSPIAEAMRQAMLRERSWSPGVWGSVVCYGAPGEKLASDVQRNFEP